MEKAEARRSVRESLDLITEEERIEYSEAIAEMALGLPEFIQSSSVMLFASLPDEFDTMPLIDQALMMGKSVYMPKVDWRRRKLLICRIDSISDLEEGYWGILEPPEERSASPEELDFIIVPGMAFDITGNRLGRGGGYYDRLLSERGMDAITCGAAYDCQIFAQIPQEEHDRTVDMLVTEQRVMRFGPDANYE